MIDYDNLPEIEMKRAWFTALEDRSNFLGPDQEPGQRFRCNLNMYGGQPRWIVGTFVVDEEAKAKTLKDREAYRENPWSPTRSAEDTYPDQDFIRARWERVIFTDGAAPEHTIEEMQRLIVRHHVTKAKLGL